MVDQNFVEMVAYNFDVTGPIRWLKPNIPNNICPEILSLVSVYLYMYFAMKICIYGADLDIEPKFCKHVLIC